MSSDAVSDPCGARLSRPLLDGAAPAAGRPALVRLPVIAGLLGLLLPGCGERPVYEIETVRDDGERVEVDKTTEDRFFRDPHAPGGAATGQGQDAGAGAALAERLRWTVPSGWEQLPPRRFREVNLRVGDTECYVTFVSAGGAAMNLNRWRGQMAVGQEPLPPLDAAAVEALKTVSVLGREAYELVAEGTYSGMGSPVIEGAMMIGRFVQFPAFAVSIKMIGPAAEVAAARAGFDAFCDSLDFGGTPAAGGASPAGTSPAGTDPHGAGGAGPGVTRHDLAWERPEGWEPGRVTPESDSPFAIARLVSFVVGDDAECYVTVLPGAAGGVIDNVNRWRGEVGQGPLEAAAIAALTKLEVLGGEQTLMRAEGGERGVAALIASVRGDTLTVKLTGPKAAVAAQHDDFLAFCRSLKLER